MWSTTLASSPSSRLKTAPSPASSPIATASWRPTFRARNLAHPGAQRDVQEIATCPPEADVEEAEQLMRDFQVHRLPV